MGIRNFKTLHDLLDMDRTRAMLEVLPPDLKLEFRTVLHRVHLALLTSFNSCRGVL